MNRPHDAQADASAPLFDAGAAPSSATPLRSPLDNGPANASLGGRCPYRPPVPPVRTRRLAVWRMLFGKRRSWLDGLFTGSYRMKMGEVHLPGLDLYMLNQPELVRRVLVDEPDRYPKHPMLHEALKPLLGDSVFTTHGAVWQRQRALLNHAFTATHVNRVRPHMQQAADAMRRRLDRHPDGTVVDVDPEMTHVTADIILRTLLSRSIDSDAAQRVYSAFTEFQALAPRLMLPAVFGLRWLTPFWLKRRSQDRARAIRLLLSDMIRPRVEARRSGERLETADLLELLMDGGEEGQPGFEFEELVDQVAMLFLAGHETSATTMSWALHLLAHSPDVQDRLHRASLNSDGAVAASQTDAAGDRHLARNVFRETLRLYPPVGFLARQSTAEAEMRRKRLKPGATLVISPWLIQRHEAYWDRPQVFDPDRYLADGDTSASNATGCPLGAEAGAASPSPPVDVPDVHTSLKTAYLPFGLGPRVCAGAGFAQQEAVLLLHALARHYRFEPVPGAVPEPVGRLTVRSANGIRLRIFRRRPEAITGPFPTQS